MTNSKRDNQGDSGKIHRFLRKMGLCMCLGNRGEAHLDDDIYEGGILKCATGTYDVNLVWEAGVFDSLQVTET